MREDECRCLLTGLLNESGVEWEQYIEWTRFRFREGGMTWELACRCGPGEVLIYSRYPMRTWDPNAVLAVCGRANGKLKQGAMFLQEGIPLFRIRADLGDPYGARERLMEALEYSAAAVIRYWGEMQAVCSKE